ncbi:hypothetical protein [Lysinibacillus xylanilyticus]|uniref:hypothetical protein n=1 Tax=Lysinibacillus xylanilyticus TaxID=582475 RepID=UPI0012FD49E5|nr:hypothetical protein [Lysinibacillus xylanilyticus]
MTNIMPLTLRFRAKNIMPLTLRFRAKNIMPLTLRFRAKDICWPKASERNLRQGEINIFYLSHYHKLMSFNTAIT